MPNFIRNLGLDFLWDDENTMLNFMGYLTEKGKAITGYYGCPMLFNPMGDIDFFVKTEKDDEGQLKVVGLDTHCCGRNIWEMRNTGIDITPKDSSPTDRVFIFTSSEDGTGLVPIHLINADVLPSFLEDDIVKMQMCAFPLDINYYADEEDYSNHQPTYEDGKHWLLADGALMPMHFLSNHELNDDEGKDCSTDDYVMFKGTVKQLHNGIFAMDGNKERTYIRCVIDTNYGELQFAHTWSQLDPEQVDNLKVGAVVSGVCVLSGDVAVKEYTDGIVKDFDNNLRLLKQVIVHGQAERMRPVLCEDATYYSEASKKTYNDVDGIIERFNYVKAAQEEECFATTATISSVDSDELEYPVGTRCVLISYGEKDNYAAIVFIDVTESGDIKRIYVSNDSRYHFSADEPLTFPSLLDDFEPPKSVVEPIYNRARFHFLINEDITVEELSNGIVDYEHHEKMADYMLNSLKENPQPDVEVAFENIFGYLFAKSIERTANKKQNESKGVVLKTTYGYNEAFEGNISTLLDEEQHNKIVKLMEKGKQFYKDFSFYIQLGEPNDDTFNNEIKTALILVQHIGHLYATENF